MANSNNITSSYDFICDKDKALVSLALMYIQVERYSLLYHPPVRCEKHDYAAESLGYYKGILAAAHVLRPDEDFYGDYVTPLRNLMYKEAVMLDKQCKGEIIDE